MDNYAALAQKYRRGVGAEVPAGFAQAPAEEIAARLNADRRYGAYLGRFIQIIMGDGRLPEVAMALFDRDGYLLRLFGPEEALTRMGDDGIREGNIWTLEAAGCSAVTVGLLEKKPLCSIGAENEHRALRKYGWYFVPIQMNEYGDRTKQLNFGGVALCVPAEAQRRGYAALVHAIAYETVMNMHFGQTANALFEVSGKSALNYDLRMLNGEATVAYCSPSLFPLLDIPYQDLYFRPMAELIDPLPDNEKFWRMLAVSCVITGIMLACGEHTSIGTVLLIAALIAVINASNWYMISYLPMYFAGRNIVSTLVGTFDFSTYVGASLMSGTLGALLMRFGWIALPSCWMALTVLGLALSLVGAGVFPTVPPEKY